MPDWFPEAAAAVLAAVFAITFHEAAHGYAALALGDDTAKRAGRISLNPIRHVDPVGTLLVPGIMVLGQLLTIGRVEAMFGWAKPVPVNFNRLRHPKRDMIWVAAAGPGANLFMAILWALFLTFQETIGLGEAFFRYMAQAGIQINLVLMALNLLPIPPLDGGRIMVGLLPNKLAYPLARVEPYGFFIIIGLLVTGTLGFFLAPFMAIGDFIVGLFR
ncbi:MAG: site-2 protease family protein [bacterium]